MHVNPNKSNMGILKTHFKNEELRNFKSADKLFRNYIVQIAANNSKIYSRIEVENFNILWASINLLKSRKKRRFSPPVGQNSG